MNYINKKIAKQLCQLRQRPRIISAAEETAALEMDDLFQITPEDDVIETPPEDNTNTEAIANINDAISVETPTLNKNKLSEIQYTGPIQDILVCDMTLKLKNETIIMTYPIAWADHKTAMIFCRKQFELLNAGLADDQKIGPDGNAISLEEYKRILKLPILTKIAQLADDFVTQKVEQIRASQSMTKMGLFPQKAHC